MTKFLQQFNVGKKATGRKPNNVTRNELLVFKYFANKILSYFF